MVDNKVLTYLHSFSIVSEDSYLAHIIILIVLCIILHYTFFTRSTALFVISASTSRVLLCPAGPSKNTGLKSNLFKAFSLSGHLSLQCHNKRI